MSAGAPTGTGSPPRRRSCSTCTPTVRGSCRNRSARAWRALTAGVHRTRSGSTRCGRAGSTPWWPTRSATRSSPAATSAGARGTRSRPSSRGSNGRPLRPAPSSSARSQQLAEARAAGTPAVLLGVEGADALGDDVDRVDAWYERGVRMVVLVHLGDNALGTTCLPWQRYAGPLPVRRLARPGLTALGARVVETDERPRRPGRRRALRPDDPAGRRRRRDGPGRVVAHRRPRPAGLPPLPHRHELAAIAGTGGLVGLWPYRPSSHGVRDLAELMAHARHIADDHRPRAPRPGHRHERGARRDGRFRWRGRPPEVTGALLDAGFDPTEVEGILGGNALRVLRQVEERGRPA